VSLILEALKKLDREKQAPDRGVLVLGATAWAAKSEGRSRLWRFLLADLLLVALGGGLVYFWLRPAAPQPAPAPAASVSPAPLAPSQVPAAALTPLPPPTAAPAPAARAARPAAASAPPPTTPAETPAPQFALQAVTEQDGQPVALISDRLLRVGEGFDGMRVVRITSTEVEIEIEATRERRTLTF
jgi:hypothetical protein